MMKIMLKIKIIENIKKIPCEWSFLTIKITIKTKKTLATDNTLTGDGKKNNNTDLLHPNYEKTTFFNMQHKHHVH